MTKQNGINHKRIWAGLLLLLFGVLSLSTTLAAGDEIIVLLIDGPVNQSMLNYFERGIQEAENRDAAAVIIELDTPGGELGATLEIIQLFQNSSTPVIVYITPAGAQAASAGSLIMLGGHASGMAPDTVVGAASPVTGEGSDIGETLFRKIVEDTQAVVRNLADERGEEVVTLAEAMIADAEAVTAQEALDVGFTDAIAIDRAELIKSLDGKTVTVLEEPLTLELANANVNILEMSRIEQALYALATVLANPVLISALIGLGVQAIIFEFSNPGGWVAGFIGFVCIGLALFGLGQLPANYFGLALIIVAFILLLMELFTPTYGALAATGTITMIFGFLVLFNSPGSAEFSRLSIPSAVAIAVLSAGMSFAFIWLGLRAQSRQVMTGSEGLVGKIGRVRQAIEPDGAVYSGTVFVYGSLWNAHAAQPIAKDDRVIVKSVDGLTIYVAPEAVGVENQLAAEN
ncbi:MAG: NfeD family protein [Chloroflexota bacterium]